VKEKRGGKGKRKGSWGKREYVLYHVLLIIPLILSLLIGSWVEKPGRGDNMIDLHSIQFVCRMGIWVLETRTFRVL